MGIFDKKSKNTTNNNDRTIDSSNETLFEGNVGIASGNLTLAGDGNTITDGGAIAGNIAVANNALKTAETITEKIGDQFNSGLQSVGKLSSGFSSALETIKKTELTNGGSIVADLLKWWPVIPIAIVATMAIKSKGKKNG